ncbi:MAG TPA: isocitrate/isopropylmalate family dehydrogenase [Streptosporangiaceae bacterium]|jgi:tartrate dehydrogenase/decarboxylase/D-malate dehydrogenase
MSSYTIALIPGDGIGLELVPGVADLAEHAAARHGVTLNWLRLDWGSSRYLETGQFMPTDWQQTLAETDAILLGAVGDPRIADHVSLWGLLLPIRRELRQSVNVRPIVSFPGVVGPLRSQRPFDILVIRENNEGEYTNVGGSLYPGTADEVVVQASIFTRHGTERLVRFGFEQAQRRAGRLMSATKSNGLPFSMPFWDTVVREVAAGYPDVSVREMHIDALAARLVLAPEEFDVIVSSNLFGDILSDLGASLVGSIGVVASANVNPVGDRPSMFEPVHGSAPDIAGQGIANPTAQVLSACMMLTHLGEAAAAEHLRAALLRALADPAGRTADIGGRATTLEALERIEKELDQGAPTL